MKKTLSKQIICKMTFSLRKDFELLQSNCFIELCYLKRCLESRVYTQILYYVPQLERSHPALPEPAASPVEHRGLVSHTFCCFLPGCLPK